MESGTTGYSPEREVVEVIFARSLNFQLTWEQSALDVTYLAIPANVSCHKR